MSTPKRVRSAYGALRPAEWRPDPDRLYTLCACDGCGGGYPVRYLAQVPDGRFLCRACFDAWIGGGDR